MAKRKKTGKTPAVSAADIVTPTDEVLAYPEQPQEIPDPEKTQPVNGEAKPFLGVFAEECNGPGEPPDMNAGPALPWPSPETEEPNQAAGSTDAPAGWFATEDTADLEGDEERMPRDGSLAADLNIGVIGEQPEEPEPSGSFCGDLPPEELPWPELNNEASADFVVKPKFDLDENLYPVQVSQNAVRADIEAEHAGITLQDTDILADADGCKTGDFVVDPLWTDTPNLQPSEPEKTVLSGAEILVDLLNYVGAPDFKLTKPSEPEPPRPSPRGSDYVPPVGSWWSMPTSEPYALMVFSSPVDGLVVCHDYVKRDGIVFNGATKIALDDFRIGLFSSELACPDWVTSSRSLLSENLRKKSTEQDLYKPLAPLVPDRFPVKMENEPSAENGAAEVANELGVEVRDVQLIVDSALHAVAGALSLKSILSCSPILQSLETPKVANAFVSILKNVCPLVFDKAFEEALSELDSVLEPMREHLGRLDTQVEDYKIRVNKLDVSISDLSAALESNVARSSAPDVVSENGIVSDVIFKFIQAELNPIREDMVSLQDRQDLVERKRLMADDQKRKNQKAHHDSMKKPKAEQLENRRARDKTARELKTVEAEKVGEIKRGRGRPRKVDAPSKSTAKPVAKPPKATAKPIVVQVDLVAGMMKKSPDKKVEKLLRGLDAKQLKRIADQLPKGLPDVSKIPGWVEADRFAFVRWYFGQSGN